MIGIPTDKFRLFINYKEVPIECLNIFCCKDDYFDTPYYIQIDFTLDNKIRFGADKYSVFCQEDTYLVNAYVRAEDEEHILERIKQHMNTNILP